MNYIVFGFYWNDCCGINDLVVYIFMFLRYCVGCGMVIFGKMLCGVS